MAFQNQAHPDYLRGLRRVVIGILAVLLLGLFLLWRIDNARVEQLRASLVDTFVPSFEWTLAPIAATTRLVSDFQSYARVYAQNEDLRRELRRMQGWREAALQLEQKNARLLALNNVRLNPRTTFVTAEVMADAGSPFSRSVLVNVGAVDGVTDGAAAVDGLGLAGRVAGVGEQSARVILLNDGSSRVPATILPSGQRALVTGDNTAAPALDFVDQSDEVKPGDRVVTSGDGGLFPADLLIGRVIVTQDGRQRVRLAADYRQLEFARVLRRAPPLPVIGPGELIGPVLPAPAILSEGLRWTPPPLWIQRMLLCALGLAAIYGALIPTSPGGGAGPDLLFCLVIAWVVRSPSSAPVWIVLPLGLLADLMLARPLGLGALGLLSVSEVFRARASGLRERAFPFEWLAASAAFALMLAGMALLLRLAFADAPSPAILARHAAATAIAYPFVALALGWGLRIGAAQPPAGALR